MTRYMTGSASPGKRTLSGLTLALFQDSGWYRVDASHVDPLTWGAGAGCSFVYDDCGKWDLPGYTCDRAAATGCTYDRRAQAYCDLKNYAHLPHDKAYFKDDDTLGGFSELLDYCPVYRAYSNGDCTDESHGSHESEERCPTCKCFSSHGLFSAPFEPLGMGCYRTRCLNTSTLELRLSGHWRRCPANGGELKVGGREGNAISYYSNTVYCPPAEELCSYDEQIWPQLSALSPARGPVAGGVPITLSGDHFASMRPPLRLALTFRDGQEAETSDIAILSSTQAVAQLPAASFATARSYADVTLSDGLGRTAFLYAAFTVDPGGTPQLLTLALLVFLVLLTLLVPLHLRKHCREELRKGAPIPKGTLKHVEPGIILV